jgi:Ni/Co efflux regulator RcnB
MQGASPGAFDCRTLPAIQPKLGYMSCMIRTAIPLGALAAFTVCAAPAWAQDSLPRFEALERQLQMNEQRDVDRIETQRQQERDRARMPGSGISDAEWALRDRELKDRRDLLLLQAQVDRARVQRERELAEAALLNARVPATSTAVVREPNDYLLPPPPPGKYYARANGRFVLVDRASELVTDILTVQPTDPTADVPAPPRPMPETGLPLRRVSPTSALELLSCAAMGLPAAPQGQFYARVDGQLVLVDARTEMPVKVVTSG